MRSAPARILMSNTGFAEPTVLSGFCVALGITIPAHEIGEYFGITMDITDQKRAEQERERLRQLETDLAHINRVNMMGELAAALAHEIKQPIAASITSANASFAMVGS
jgi:signal transduction histidine kinase